MVFNHPKRNSLCLHAGPKKPRSKLWLKWGHLENSIYYPFYRASNTHCKSSGCVSEFSFMCHFMIYNARLYLQRQWNYICKPPQPHRRAASSCARVAKILSQSNGSFRIGLFMQPPPPTLPAGTKNYQSGSNKKAVTLLTNHTKLFFLTFWSGAWVRARLHQRK